MPKGESQDQPQSAHTEAEADTDTEKRETARKRASPSAPVTRLEGISEEVWDAWLALRKQKKAPVTRTVVNTALKEAAKARMTPEAFFALWCYRGSVGLMADWIKPEERRESAESRSGETVDKLRQQEEEFRSRSPEQIESANRARLAAVSAIKRVG